MALREVSVACCARGPGGDCRAQPMSLWGLRQMRTAVPALDHRNPVFGRDVGSSSVFGMRDWLRLLSFGSRPTAFGCVIVQRCACRMAGALRGWILGEKRWPILGLATFAAVKRVHGMRLVTHYARAASGWLPRCR